MGFSEMSETDRRGYIVFVLVSFTSFVNSSYFSLWVMEGLAGEGESSYKQFNKTLFISSIFFLAASFILFVVAHIYIGCRVQEESGEAGQERNSNNRAGELSWLIKPFLIGYGLIMMAVFMHWKSQWQYMVIPIIPFGFIDLIVNIYSDKIGRWKEEDKRRYGTHRLNFLIEVQLCSMLDCGLFDIASVVHDRWLGQIRYSYIWMA